MNDSSPRTSAVAARNTSVPAPVSSSSTATASCRPRPHSTVRHGMRLRSSENAHAIAIIATSPSAETQRSPRSLTRAHSGRRARRDECSRAAASGSRCARDRRDHAHGGGAGAHHVGGARRVDAADRDDRSRRRDPHDLRERVESARVVLRVLRRGAEERPERDVVDGSSRAARACSSVCVERPTSSRARARAGMRAGGRSCWPRWTPSAPAASARSKRSFTKKSAPCSRASARIASGPRERLRGRSRASRAAARRARRPRAPRAPARRDRAASAGRRRTST